MEKSERDALVGTLFARITARFEDGAALAVQGQRPKAQDMAAIVGSLRRYATDIHCLLDAAIILWQDEG